MNFTSRRHPRSTREAFREWPENCYGVEFPPAVPTQPSIFQRIGRWFARWFTY